MNIKFALMTMLATLAPAALVGCASADASEGGAPEAVELAQEALAAGIQTVNLYASALGLGAAQGQDSASPVATFKFAKGNVKFETFTGTLTEVNVTGSQGVRLSKDVADLAVLLKLGAFVSFDAGAGSGYYVFANGNVRIALETGSVRDVTFKSASSAVSGEAALAAARSRLGTFVRISDSGNYRTATFTAGAVKYNNQTGLLEDVTLTGVAGASQNAAAALGLGAYVRGTHERGVDHDFFAKGRVDFNTFTGKLLHVEVSNQNTLPPYVVELAVGLKLGSHVGSDGALGTQTETFQKGEIVWNNHEGGPDGVLKQVTVTTTGGASVELPLPVAQAAAANVFGTLVSIEGAAGSAYYSYADGVIRWSNVTQTLAGVTLK
ncbi:hypothetical protein [Pendulispora albinea]|uniref:Lipoprotein n=1 Tax=Pendulispora albinea TaxID=2741071 RepID=A0ABZ2M182_9BACT